MMQLYEHTKDEWRGIVKQMKPGLTDEDYDRMWVDFIAMKRVSAECGGSA